VNGQKAINAKEEHDLQFCWFRF